MNQIMSHAKVVIRITKWTPRGYREVVQSKGQPMGVSELTRTLTSKGTDLLQRVWVCTGLRGYMRVTTGHGFSATFIDFVAYHIFTGQNNTLFLFNTDSLTDEVLSTSINL